MTTSQSPITVLHAQAVRIAGTLKDVADGKKTAYDPAGKLKASLAAGEVVAGIVMDDKIIKVTISWDLIRNSTQIALADWIVQYMQGKTHTKH